MSLNLDIPDAPRLRDTLAALCLLLLCAIAGGVGYWLGRGDAPRPENVAAAPAQRQADGSLVLARESPAQPPPAPHAIPRNAVRERAIGVDVQPAREDCPPTHVDLSLIRDGDGRRVIASSPDGRVIGGFDVPLVAGLVPPPPRHWAAGVRYDPIWQTAGVWIERDVSRIRIGVDVGQVPRGGLQAGVSVGWTW